MKKRVIVVALACAPMCGFAACGGEKSSDEDQVRDVIALGNAKDPDVCDRLTDKWMKEVVGGDKTDCEQQVKQSPKNAVKVEEISIVGDRATVTAQIQGDPGRLFLAREDGEWKLDDVEQGG